MNQAGWLAVALALVNMAQALALAYIAAKTKTIASNVDGAMSTLLSTQATTEELAKNPERS